MFFNSFEYLAFFALCLAVYWSLKHRAQNLFLLGASYFFYECWDWRFLSLILISTGVDFWAGKKIFEARAGQQHKRQKRYLYISLAVNLGILGFFKYFNFFAGEASSLFSAMGLPLDAPTLNIVLPVGISFYTFQTLSYTIDIYRGKLDPAEDFFDFALFVAFFPQLVAGPIERARNLLPQICGQRRIELDNIAEGGWLILIGLARKVIIADTAAVFVDKYFADPADRGRSRQLASACPGSGVPGRLVCRLGGSGLIFIIPCSLLIHQGGPSQRRLCHLQGLDGG